VDAGVPAGQVLVLAVVDGTRVDSCLGNEIEAGSALEIEKQGGRWAETETDAIKNRTHAISSNSGKIEPGLD